MDPRREESCSCIRTYNLNQSNLLLSFINHWHVWVGESVLVSLCRFTVFDSNVIVFTGPLIIDFPYEADIVEELSSFCAYRGTFSFQEQFMLPSLTLHPIGESRVPFTARRRDARMAVQVFVFKKLFKSLSPNDVMGIPNEAFLIEDIDTFFCHVRTSLPFKHQLVLSSLALDPAG
mmetsp:Transcript_691/g.1062  ORF Transcript_691/g.1062 Transcript_691/m.1062 type:complete len:176 (+) Transcript_691:175-702(+)